jgi:hypothetical protein
VIEFHQLDNSNSSAMDAHPARRTWRVVITVAGRVVRVRARPDGGWRVRLADTGGALAAAEIRPSNPLPLPAVGARIVLRGCVYYDPDHGWYVVDPVEEWLEAS